MNLEVINEPIVAVRDLYIATDTTNKHTFSEWCFRYLPVSSRTDYIVLKDAILLLNTYFNLTGAIADWIEKHTDFGVTKEDQKLQKALEYIKGMESKYITLRNSNAQLSHELAMLQSLYCKKEIDFENFKKEVITEFIRNEDHK